MALSCLTACNRTQTQETTSSTTGNPLEPSLQYGDDNDSTLISCIGQADEDGRFVVPENVKMIAESAFAGDTSLKEVVIGPNVKVIGSGAFQYCTALERVTLSEGIETIGSHAFLNCISLENITLPSTVTVLNEYVFAACESLESISLEYIIKVGESAFAACTSLESVELSSELESIGNWAFSRCDSLESISFNGVTKLTEIGDYVFTGCTMLRSIDIPEGVRRIGILAFYNCYSLSSVTIPASVEVVDFGAFNDTYWYQYRKDDYLIVGDGVLIKCTVHPSELDLSDKGIKMIGGTAFYNAAANGEPSDYGYKYAEALESIVIPEGVREIGKSAFAGCIALKSITLNKDLVRIDSRAFNLFVSSSISSATVNLDECTKLEYIGSYAFQGCAGIEELNLSDTVTSVGEYAFQYTKAQDNFIKAASEATEEKDRYWISGDILLLAYVAEGQTAIHVPEGVKIIAGAALCGWDEAYAPDDPEDLLADGLSKYNITNNVTELHLPEGLEVIESMAFLRMACIETVDLPSTLRVIGENAFYFCTKLREVTGGESLETIGGTAFCYCTSLAQFTMPETVTDIGASIFAGCTSLKTVYLPRNAENPGSSLFDESCTALVKVYANASVRPRIYYVLGPVQQSLNVDYYK